MPLMLPGALVAMLGFAVLMVVVFGAGGANRQRQVGVASEVLAGARGRGRKLWFLAGLLMTVLGTCGAFAGVAAQDQRQRDACDATCESRGYAKAEIRGSNERDPPGSKRHAFIACVCSEGTDLQPWEMPADEL